MSSAVTFWRLSSSIAASALAFGAAAASSRAAATGCNLPHARTILTTPALRVVSAPLDRVYRKNNTHVVGRNFFACAKPGGRARKIGFIYKEYATTGAVKGMTPVDSGLTSFGRTAGTFIITRTREADLTGSFAEQTYRVVDVATGHRYTFFHHLVSEAATKPEPAPPVTVRLDPSGRLAAILSAPHDEGYSAPAVGNSQVVVFSPRGARTVLDDGAIAAIPSSSLTLSNDVVGWTHDGRARSAVAPS
jgi:hypothetical protein